MSINKSTTSKENEWKRNSFQKGHMQTDLVSYWWNSSIYKAMTKIYFSRHSFTHNNQSKPKIDSKLEAFAFSKLHSYCIQVHGFILTWNMKHDEFMYSKLTERIFSIVICVRHRVGTFTAKRCSAFQRMWRKKHSTQVTSTEQWTTHFVTIKKITHYKFYLLK